MKKSVLCIISEQIEYLPEVKRTGITIWNTNFGDFSRTYVDVVCFTRTGCRRKWKVWVRGRTFTRNALK